MRALRYRRGQALAIVALTALIVASAVLGPIYARAMLQSVTSSRIEALRNSESGLRLSSGSSAGRKAIPPDVLDSLLPSAVRSMYQSAVKSITATVVQYPTTPKSRRAQILWRSDMCSHLGWTSGRCPEQAGEVAISAASAASLKLSAAAPFVLREEPDGDNSLAPIIKGTIVGIYEQPPNDPYWFDASITGYEGHSSDRALMDTVLVTEADLTQPRPTAIAKVQHAILEPVTEVDYVLRQDRVTYDNVVALGEIIGPFVQHPPSPPSDVVDPGATFNGSVGTNLIDTTNDLKIDKEQADTTVPLLLYQLSILLLAVLWLVLVAVTDQRRGEIAVTRLRGRGRMGAQLLLGQETVTATILGIPLGLALAVGMSWVARHTLLEHEPAFEWPTGAWRTTGLVSAALIGLVLVAIRRVASESLATLLHRVPPRTSGVRLGIIEAMLVAGAFVGYLAISSGDPKGPVALLAPLFMALALGLVLGRLITPVYAVVGRALLRAGRPTSGAALLQAGRRSTTRWLVPVVTVAVAVVAFSTNAFTVAERNREFRGLAETGSPMVALTDAKDGRALREAVAAFDPDGRDATPVVLSRAATQAGVEVAAVVPDQFARMAFFPTTGRLAAANLPQHKVAPFKLTGAELKLTIDGATRPKADSAAELYLRMVTSEGQETDTLIGVIPQKTPKKLPYRTLIACRTGCYVSAIVLRPPAFSPSINGDVTIRDATVDGKPIAWGATNDWAPPPADVGAVTVSVDGATLALSARNVTAAAPIEHMSAPTPQQAVLTTTAVTLSNETGLTMSGVTMQGLGQDFQPTPRVLPYTPGAHAQSIIADYDESLLHGSALPIQGKPLILFARNDPALLDRAKKALATKKIGIVSVTYAEKVTERYKQTAAGLSVQLALVISIFAVLVAILALIVLSASAWRARSRDYAGLRLTGMTRAQLARISVGEYVPAIALSSLLGGVAGWLAARATKTRIPLFTKPPSIPILDPSLDYRTLLGSAALAAALLLLVGFALGWWTAHRSPMERLRDAD